MEDTILYNCAKIAYKKANCELVMYIIGTKTKQNGESSSDENQNQ